MIKCSFKDLKPYQQELLLEAEKAMDNAYCPYSGFSVGAALLTENNLTITGSNVENASYGITICAERAAIIRANALGKRRFKSIAVIAGSKKYNAKEPTAPCGACRQMLYESSVISERNIEIIISNTDKTNVIISSIIELLPLAFGPENLNNKNLNAG